MTLPKRKNNRLANYDYSSAGAYFLTVCTHNRKKLLSNVVGAIHEYDYRFNPTDYKMYKDCN